MVLKLTDEQQKFCEFIKNLKAPTPGNAFTRAVLNAGGGTGKSTTIKHLMGNPFIQVLAPTQKACSLFRANGIPAKTIHAFLNAKEDVDEITGEILFEFTRKDAHKKLTLLVDECSMVGKDMFEALIALPCHVIFIGDECQLPPVKEGLSSSFSVGTNFQFTVNKRLDRNRDSMSANYLKLFRENVYKPSKIRVNKQDRKFMMKTFQDNDDTILLAWTNKNVNAWNATIRSHLFNEKEEDLKALYEGERLIFSGFRQTQDLKYYSSDEVRVRELQECTVFIPYKKCDCKHQVVNKVSRCDACGIKGHSVLGHDLNFYHFKDQHGVKWYYPKKGSRDRLNEIMGEYRAYCKMKKNKNIWWEYYAFENMYAPDLKYRYAMTVHKAQGSEYDTVFVDIDNIRFNRNEFEQTRMIYTAVSRFKRVMFFV